jgi:hypothetical protein
MFGEYSGFCIGIAYEYGAAQGVSAHVALGLSGGVFNGPKCATDLEGYTSTYFIAGGGAAPKLVGPYVNVDLGISGKTDANPDYINPGNNKYDLSEGGGLGSLGVGLGAGAAFYQRMGFIEWVYCTDTCPCEETERYKEMQSLIILYKKSTEEFERKIGVGRNKPKREPMPHEREAWSESFEEAQRRNNSFR